MISLRFHRSLYAPEALASAVEAYGELATFELAEEGESTSVSIADIDADFAEFPDEFADAFSNHVLFEAIRLRRAGSPA